MAAWTRGLQATGRGGLRQALPRPRRHRHRQPPRPADDRRRPRRPSPRASWCRSRPRSGRRRRGDDLAHRRARARPRSPGHPEPRRSWRCCATGWASTASSSATPSTWPAPRRARHPGGGGARPGRRLPTCCASGPTSPSPWCAEVRRRSWRRSAPAGLTEARLARPPARVGRCACRPGATAARRTPTSVAGRGRAALGVEGALPDLRGAAGRERRRPRPTSRSARPRGGCRPTAASTRRRPTAAAADGAPRRPGARRAPPPRGAGPAALARGRRTPGVVVEWGWPGPYDGRLGADLHARLVSAGVAAVDASCCARQGGTGDRDGDRPGHRRRPRRWASCSTRTERSSPGAQADRPGAEGVVATAPGRRGAAAARSAGGSTRPGRRRRTRPGRRRARGRSRTPSTSASTATGLPCATCWPSGSACRSSWRTTSTRPRSAPSRCGADDLVYLSVGTGLAAGLVLDGRLRRGEHGAAGEIGHVPVDPVGPGAAAASAAAWRPSPRARALAAAWPSGDQPPAAALFAAAAAGDAAAAAVRDRFAEGWRGDPGAQPERRPRTIVLGGGVAEVGRAVADGGDRRPARAGGGVTLPGLPRPGRPGAGGAGGLPGRGRRCRAARRSSEPVA